MIQRTRVYKYIKGTRKEKQIIEKKKKQQQKT